MNTYNQTLRADRRRRVKAFLLTTLIYGSLIAFFFFDAGADLQEILPDTIKDILGIEPIEEPIEAAAPQA